VLLQLQLLGVSCVFTRHAVIDPRLLRLASCLLLLCRTFAHFAIGLCVFASCLLDRRRNCCGVGSTLLNLLARADAEDRDTDDRSENPPRPQ